MFASPLDEGFLVIAYPAGNMYPPAIFLDELGMERFTAGARRHRFQHMQRRRRHLRSSCALAERLGAARGDSGLAKTRINNARVDP